jgi:AraC family transcriptional regulator
MPLSVHARQSDNSNFEDTGTFCEGSGRSERTHHDKELNSVKSFQQDSESILTSKAAKTELSTFTIFCSMRAFSFATWSAAIGLPQYGYVVRNCFWDYNMLIELHQKRDKLSKQAVVTDSGTSIYRRLQAGEGEFQYKHVTVGFVLNNLPSREVAFGRDQYKFRPLQAGMGWVLPANLEAKARWHEELDFLNIHISEAAILRLNNGELPSFQALDQVSDPTLVHMALNLHESANEDDAVLKMYRDTMMFALVAHVNRVYGGSKPEPIVSSIDPRLQRAISMAEDKFAENLSLEQLASEAAMSPFHFARSFKRATGLPPHKFLASKRIDRAKELLKTTTLPIMEIAFRVGYEDVSHFTDLFRRMTGGTPGEFRSA